MYKQQGDPGKRRNRLEIKPHEADYFTNTIFFTLEKSPAEMR
jgi:hypothetical protein